MTRVALLALLAAFVSGCADQPGDELFRHRIIDASPNAGFECCTDICCLGDINGDGYLDIVIGGEHADGYGLVWYEHPTWLKHPIASGEFTTDGQTADVDGDGDVDVVISNYGSGIYWYENPGTAYANSWPAHLIGDGYGHDLEVGDVDADGDIDVVTCDKKSVLLWRRPSVGLVSGNSEGLLADAGPEWSRVVVLERAGEGIALHDLDGDADLDIVYGGMWLEAPELVGEDGWPEHSIDGSWHPETRAQVADMNGDGRGDVLLTVSEGDGPLAWFAAPADPKKSLWVRHDIDSSILSGAHSLQIADFNGDGALDVLTAEMHTSDERRVLLYLAKGDTWDRRVLAEHGSHNMRAGDIGNDGDIDIVGKNYKGVGRAIEMWENLSNGTGWTYVAVDNDRPASQMGKMGLVFADADGDGFQDIVAGSFIYRNPGGDPTAEWARHKLPGDVDVYFHPGLVECDLVGVADSKLVYLESITWDNWRSHSGATIPAGRTQGYAMAHGLGRFAEGGPDLVFTRGKSLFCLEDWHQDSVRPWGTLVQLSAENEEEGIALGDIDRDGDIDIAAYASDGHQVLWLENPGDGTANFVKHVIGSSREWLDRIALVDINGDGRLDIVSTEETQDWEYNAGVYWFEAPADPRTASWPRHRVTTLRSVNSMDAADMDGDGDVDIVAAEHTDQRDALGAPDNLTVWFENRDGGRAWIAHPIDVGGRSSHLGARLCDVDNDGNLDVVSIAWRQFSDLHLWLNTGHK